MSLTCVYTISACGLWHVHCTCTHVCTCRCLKCVMNVQVPVDGEMVKSNELFSDELSLTELKVCI